LTLFAPADEAYANLPEGNLEALLADHDRLIAVVGYHMVQCLPVQAVTRQDGKGIPRTLDRTVNWHSMTIQTCSGGGTARSEIQSIAHIYIITAILFRAFNNFTI
jgi:uncharacterized surface protein with fasciclin (FAS1) repeats